MSQCKAETICVGSVQVLSVLGERPCSSRTLTGSRTVGKECFCSLKVPLVRSSRNGSMLAGRWYAPFPFFLLQPCLIVEYKTIADKYRPCSCLRRTSMPSETRQTTSSSTPSNLRVSTTLDVLGSNTPKSSPLMIFDDSLSSMVCLLTPSSCCKC
jgi:hypothetical protein